MVVIAGFLVFWLTQTEWLTSSHLWQKAEGTLIDRRYLLRGEDLPDPNVQLVGLGTSSFKLDALAPEEIAASPTLQLMQHPWPWDRSVYAAILEKLMGAGAKVVMFDFVFASETDGDAVFAQALEKYKDRVVIGEMFADEIGADSRTKKLTTPNERLLLPGTESVVGLVNIWTDPDEIVRHGHYRTSIERESGLRGYPNNLTHITVLAAKKFTGKTTLPLQDRPNLIDFQGGAGTYRPMAVEEMFVDKIWNGRGRGFNGGLVFSNKLVIVGPMAEIFHDVHDTPFGEMPGPEVQAQMMAALLHGSWLEETSKEFNQMLALAASSTALSSAWGMPRQMSTARIIAARASI